MKMVIDLPHLVHVKARETFFRRVHLSFLQSFVYSIHIESCITVIYRTNNDQVIT